MIFGPETSSINEEVLTLYQDRIITLPHLGPVRSLNLAQCASIICFEAIRQQSQS